MAPTAPVRPLLVIRGGTMAQRGAEQLSRAGAGRAATSPRRWMQLMHCLMRPNPITDHIFLGGGGGAIWQCSDSVVSVGGRCISLTIIRCPNVPPQSALVLIMFVFIWDKIHTACKSMGRRVIFFSYLGSGPGGIF